MERRQTELARTVFIHQHSTIATTLVETIILHPLCGLLGIVRQNNVSSCSLEAGEGLQNNILLLKPALFACSLDHSIFTRHVVRGNGEGSGILQATDDIQVGHTRLDHEHIGTLGGIQSSLNESLPSIGRVLLVRLLITESGVAVESITEGTVVCRGILGGVSKDGNISESLRIKSIADGTNTSILSNNL